MAKGWTKVKTINDIPSKTKDSKNSDRQAQNIIRNTKTLKYDDLFNETIENYEKKKAEENFLLSGFEEKKLKSKQLIKQATSLSKQKNKTKENKEADS